ncbi:MAG: hypothetical protein CVT92_02210 [Bacteroidetes bacterium HGW-Bacteroidetes-1]|jgi:hypothetical protein|nr:MAG: hypothetical protein CVT92_02210 [Bacteroidetes bacterium HGW-Bacteroidetes-1]
MDNLRTILAKFLANLYLYIIDADYYAAYISFVWACFHIITQNPMFFSDIFLFLMTLGLYILRRINSIINKIESIETALNGAKIKRVEIEVMKGVI